MIRSVSYKKFKRYDSVIVDLKPKITVLVGPNSSGKSSLLKGLLAFKQTYDDPTDHTGFVAEGAYVDIGHFNEYVKDHDTKDEVTFIFEISGYSLPALRAINLRAFQKAFISIRHQEDPQTKHGRVSEYVIYFSTSLETKPDEIHELKNYVIYKRMQKSDETFKVEVSFDLFRMFRQYTSFRTVENFESMESSFFERLNQRFANGSIQASRDNQRGMISRITRGGFDEAVELIGVIERALVLPVHGKLVEDITQKTYALAALREKPSRSVKRTDERRTVGSEGENTASVYFAMRQKSIKAGGARNSKIQEDFQRLDRWFKYLKLGTDIEINSWRDLIDMRTRTTDERGQSDSVVDIGVGFSQVAPILVQLAAMPDDGLLITEQPELHLYPWAQTRLGKIMCEEVARSEKRIVIETHSEHLIGGIQLHISEHRTQEGVQGLGPGDVQILYVDSDATVRRIDLDIYGEFTSEWPSGFFDQTIETYRAILSNKVAK